MPYKIVDKDSKHYVINQSNEEVGAYDTKSEAVSCIRSLMVAENKELYEAWALENKENDFGPTSFIELSRLREAQATANLIRELYWDFDWLLGNVIWGSDEGNIASAVRQLSNEFASLIEQANAMKEVETKESPGFVKKLINAVKEVVPVETVDTDPDSSMLFWKDKGGTYKWMASYSNKYRDDDRPAEIISSKSHQKHEKMVDAGLVPAPDLWLWHVPEWQWGEGEWVAYDDLGFACAGGRVYDEFKDLAETMMRLDGVGVSHGMPKWSIKREVSDKSIIDEHFVVEVSPLPIQAAANKLAGLVSIYESEEDMALSKEKKAELVEQWGISPELVSRLEAFNARKAKEAHQQDRESKEVEGTTEQTTEAQAEAVAESQVAEQVEEVQKEAEPVEAESQPEEVESSTLKELEANQGQMITAMLQISEAINAVKERLDAFEAVKAQEASEEKSIKQTPLASLMGSLINKSVVGNDEARVDGRESLAKDTPQETEAEVPQVTPVPFLNQIIAAQRGGQRS
jgi:hypothetical protein